MMGGSYYVFFDVAKVASEHSIGVPPERSHPVCVSAFSGARQAAVANTENRNSA